MKHLQIIVKHIKYCDPLVKHRETIEHSETIERSLFNVMISVLDAVTSAPGTQFLAISAIEVLV